MATHLADDSDDVVVELKVDEWVDMLAPMKEKGEAVYLVGTTGASKEI